MKTLIAIYKETWRLLPFAGAVVLFFVGVLGYPLGILFLCTEVSLWFLLLFLLAPLWLASIKFLGDWANSVANQAGLE